MTPAESLLIILLAIIAWLLYQIAKQLSYLTGKRIKFPFSTQPPKHFPLKPYNPQPKREKDLDQKKLPN